MGLIPIILIGIGLSFDTFAVSISCGLIEKKMKFLQACRIAFFFALFQAIMPIIGWLLGSLVKDYILVIDHWIAFVLLLIIGAKMIHESFKKEDERTFNPHALKVILIMSFATTIDAFIIGITFAFLNVNLLFAAAIIGLVTFFAAMLGMLSGKKVGTLLGRKMEIIGGLILISIGLKILFEHIFAQ